MKSLCVEGWRSIAHSYAVANQWQLLSLLKRTDISLSVHDLPFFNKNWRTTKGLFNAADEEKLASIPTLATAADVTFRVGFPFNFSPSANGRTIVFGTSEFQYLDHATSFVSSPDIKNLAISDAFSVVTCSRWSREGFLRLGLRDDQVKLVPLGVSKDYFYPSELMRQQFREKFRPPGFVFANASAMTANKGTDILLKAFATVAERRPDVRLMLKGSDSLYGSKDLLEQAFSMLTPRQQSTINNKIQYIGDSISMNDMANFYRAADAYVSPYRAEGFNLPPLESLACGTPVICTKGGSTDDFLEDEYALRIDSVLTKTSFNEGVQLAPNLDHLIELMFRMMDDDSWRRNASVAGARRIAAMYDWDVTVEQLVDVLFGDWHSTSVQSRK